MFDDFLIMMRDRTNWILWIASIAALIATIQFIVKTSGNGFNESFGLVVFILFIRSIIAFLSVAIPLFIINSMYDFIKDIMERKSYRAKTGFDSEFDMNYHAKKEIEKLCSIASKWETMQEYENAIGITDSILDKKRDVVEALLIRARSLHNLNYHLDAIEDFERAKNIQELGNYDFVLLANCYSQTCQYEKGAENLKIAIEKGAISLLPAHLEMIESIIENPELRKALLSLAEESGRLKRRDKKSISEVNLEIDELKYLEAKIKVTKEALALDHNRDNEIVLDILILEKKILESPSDYRLREEYLKKHNYLRNRRA